jgi:nucleoside permease NupC
LLHTSLFLFLVCGFANPASAGVTLATLAEICPSRREDISELIFRGFVAGNIVILQKKRV